MPNTVSTSSFITFPFSLSPLRSLEINRVSAADEPDAFIADLFMILLYNQILNKCCFRFNSLHIVLSSKELKNNESKYLRRQNLDGKIHANTKPNHTYSQSKLWT